VILKNQNGGDIRLKDIGEAVLGPENEETVLKESRIPMIAMALVPQPGSNYVAISNEFYKRFEELKKEVPPDIKLDVTLDQNQIHQEFNS
jgi:multidrug efflux pump